MTIWQGTAFDMDAVAADVGPFAGRDFLEVVSDHDEGEPLIVTSANATVPLRRVGNEILFVGDPEVTDYHTPLGDGVREAIESVAREHPAARFVLDSLPSEASEPLAAGLTAAGRQVSTREHEVSAVVDLPASFDDYLSGIGKKERHEVRRKRRRYERALGEVRHETHRGQGWVFDEFVRLHRRSMGDKGEFLTDDRLELFAALAGRDGWRLDLLRVDSEGAAAVVFGYSDPTGYYLYNSAYDPDLGDASPGVVLLGSMIEQAIGEGLEVFDFLKGDETYKFRLGARRRPLIELVADRAESP